MRLLLLACLLALSSAAPAFAQSAADPVAEAPSEIRDLDSIVITGTQPGPGMWKVSKGDHVLWVLGTLSPLPKKMQWQSRDVENVIAQAQEVIQMPSVSVSTGTGFFRSLMLVPSLLGMRKNPDGATLREVVPADLYARWSTLKSKYIGRDGGIEKWRPIFAALELYEKAIAKSGLDAGGSIHEAVRHAAKTHKVKLTRPEIKVKIAEPKAAIKEFSSASLRDLDCFRKTMDRIETDLATMTARANAWAIGDVEALRGLPYSDQNEACRAAISEVGLARKLGLGDVPTRVEQAWLVAAEAALANNQVSFAVLPIARVLSPDGYIAKLQAQGYLVEAPE